MTKLIGAVVGVLLLGMAGVAAAAEAAGEIAEINLQARTIVVVLPGECACTGTTYVLAPEVNMGGLSAGIQVKLTYTVSGNANLVSKWAK